MTQDAQGGSSNRSSAAAVALLGGVGIIVGSIAPWATVSAGVFQRSVAGMDGDGKITIALGIVVALFALIAMTSTSSRAFAILMLLAALAAGAIGIYDTVNVSDKANEAESFSEYVSASVGWGLYVVIGGSTIALIGALMLLNATPTTDTVQSPAGSEGGLRPCPYCAELIQPNAQLCRFCGRTLEQSSTQLAPPTAGTGEGWLPDPSGRHPDRWWDGSQWTQWVRDNEGGTRSEDPPLPNPTA